MIEGTTVYYVEENCVYSGTAVDIEYTGNDYIFSIDSYGDCGGRHRIASSQIGRTVFLTREEALMAVIPEGRG